jgi:NADP-dependent aldehyde dehydrogenase
MELQGYSFIGKRRSAEGVATFFAVNPSTGERLSPPFHEATEDEADAALDLATKAFAEHRFSSAERKAQLLETIAQEILGLGDALVSRAAAETGLPEARITAERARTVSQLGLFAEIVREGSWVDARIDRALPERKPIARPDVRRMWIPVGPVVVFGASNFPLAFSVAGGDTASALAAGNPVIHKAHPGHPGTAEMAGRAVMQAVEKCRLPEGVFSLLHSTRPALSTHLVRHPLARAVGFTGSLRAGRALFDAAAARPDPIPVHAEMGSINPVFLLPAALREGAEAIAEGLEKSVTLGVGQFCTNPGLVVGLRGDDLERFLAKLGRRIEAFAPGTLLCEAIRRSYEAGIERLRSMSGVIVVAQSCATADPSRNQGGAVVFATDAERFLEEPGMSEEVFGPSTIVVRCGSREEMEAVARSLPGQLTATVHARAEDLDGFRALLGILEGKAGRLIWGGYPTGVEVCHAMHHGGPYPATTDARSTSVGTAAIGRFARPVCYQDFPKEALPLELRDENARGIWRLVDGRFTRDDVAPC